MVVSTTCPDLPRRHDRVWKARLALQQDISIAKLRWQTQPRSRPAPSLVDTRRTRYQSLYRVSGSIIPRLSRVIA